MTVSGWRTPRSSRTRRSHLHRFIAQVPSYFAAHGILAVERVMTDNHWSKRHVFTSNAECAAALAPWLEGNNTCRRHSALGGIPSISRL